MQTENVQSEPDTQAVAHPESHAAIDQIAFLRIEPEMVESIWPRCISYLQNSFSPLVSDYDIADLYKECRAGQCQLWVAVGLGRIMAAVITMISVQPKSRSCTIVHLAGEDMRLWIKELDKEITKFARSHDCRYIEAVTRRGFSRFVPDFVEDGIIHVKVIGDNTQ